MSAVPPVRCKWVAVLSVAVLLMATGVGRSSAFVPPKPHRHSGPAERPVMPRVFKVALHSGYVMYVFTYQHWQGVRVLFYRDRKGRFRVSKSVEYSVGSESGVGNPHAWPDLSAKAEGGRVSAHFGPLGSVDMHFVRSKGSRQYQPSCGGGAVRFARGHYEGTVRFAGGNGLPAVDASVAQIAPSWELEERCTGGIVEGPPTLPGAVLYAGSVYPNAPHLTVFKDAVNAHSRIWAYVSESRRGVDVRRFAAVVVPPSAFRYDQSLTKATVRPPAPFSGVGLFDGERERRHRWSGGLSVDFPGRENVSLTHFPVFADLSPARWNPPRPKKRG